MYRHAVGVKKEHNVIIHYKKLQYFVLKLQCLLHMYYAKPQMLLHKATDGTTNNYTTLQTKLHTHATHTN